MINLFRIIRKIPKGTYAIGAFLYRVNKSFLRSNGIIVSNSLTFSLVFAFIPLSIALASISSWLPFSSRIVDNIEYFYFNHFIPQSGAQIYLLFKQSFEHSARLSVIGFMSLIVSCYGIMFTVEQHVNVIFDKKRSRPFWHSIIIFTLMLFSVVIFVYLLGLLASKVDDFFAQFTNEHLFFRIINMLIAHGMTFYLFFMIYKFMPYRKISFKNSLLVALIATILFVIVQTYFIFSMRNLHDNYTLLYGSLAILPIFLLWVYFEVVIILLSTALLFILEEKPHWKMRLRRKNKVIPSKLSQDK